VSIVGNCSSNAALELSQKYNTKKKAVHLFHKKKKICILKFGGLKTHQSLPVFATFCLFLPVWCGLGSATMFTSEKYYWGLVSKM
jgi:hypothetical protein